MVSRLFPSRPAADLDSTADFPGTDLAHFSNMISSLNRRRAQRMRALILTVTILVLGAAPLWAFGRAGGGDHYSGSGGSGGSSSSGGGSSDWGGGYGSSSGPSHYRSGSDVNSPELFLIVFVLVIVILMIAIIFYLLHPTTEAQQDSLILAEGRREARRNLRALRNIDPDFSLVAFTDFSHGIVPRGARGPRRRQARPLRALPVDRGATDVGGGVAALRARGPRHRGRVAPGGRQPGRRCANGDSRALRGQLHRARRRRERASLVRG